LCTTTIEAQYSSKRAAHYLIVGKIAQYIYRTIIVVATACLVVHITIDLYHSQAVDVQHRAIVVQCTRLGLCRLDDEDKGQ
jgi:hypothetical protein